MTQTKFEIIRDDENEIRAYKLGDYYLCKLYTWANNYSWIISKELIYFLFDHDFSTLYDNGTIELAHSCREGKQILRDRFVNA